MPRASQLNGRSGSGIVFWSACHEFRVLRKTNFYTIVVAVTVAVQFAFVGYGVIGGFLALRWPTSSVP
jgi:hypothetical protein